MKQFITISFIVFASGCTPTIQDRMATVSDSMHVYFRIAMEASDSTVSNLKNVSSDHPNRDSIWNRNREVVSYWGTIFYGAVRERERLQKEFDSLYKVYLKQETDK